MPKPSREEIGTAIGAIVFLKLSQQDRSKLFEGVTDPVDWGVISNFTRQALRAPRAAGTLSAHFVAHLQVLHAHLEPQMYIGGASPCVADLVLRAALRARSRRSTTRTSGRCATSRGGLTTCRSRSPRSRRPPR